MEEVVKGPMKGYKAFYSDLTCYNNFQYEIGKTYMHKGEIEPCKSGFHFCESIADCYIYYNMSKDDTRICEVEALGEIKTDDCHKYVTNKIKIVAEVTEEWKRKGNIDNSSSGYCNSGKYNSGNWNTGKVNAGDSNTGKYNTGNNNSGDWNTGSKNSGDWNTGSKNSGDCNTGAYNIGSNNSSFCNIGSGNTGDFNSGDSNAGGHNSGDWNTGNWNSGEYNSGDFNSGNHSAGCFCTKKYPTIKFFDKNSNWTFNDWQNSKAYLILNRMPFRHSEFIFASQMSEQDKYDNPEYETIGGFVHDHIVTPRDRQKWWDELSEEDKNEIKSLPNFDPEKFKDCTGIIVE